EDRLLSVRISPALVGQLEDVDAIERPAVRVDDCLELLGGLGQRDVKAPLAALGALDQEAQRERRLARAGRSLEQVDAPTRQAAAEDLVEALDPGRGAIARRVPAGQRRCRSSAHERGP